jgi:anti-repressor protein
MKEMEIFKNEEFGEVRVVEKDGVPWFVAKDVCDILELTNPTEALRGLEEEEKANLSSTEVRNIPNRGVRAVNESGLYSLIFKSRKPEAKKFKKCFCFACSDSEEEEE